jgi:hypothetical protein
LDSSERRFFNQNQEILVSTYGEETNTHYFDSDN